MKKKMNIRAMLAVFMSVCMLGTVTACGDSDNDDKGTDKKSSSSYSDEDNKKSNSDSKKSSKNDDDDDEKGNSDKDNKKSDSDSKKSSKNDDDMEDRKFSSDDKEGQERSDESAKSIYLCANSVLCDMEDEGLMSDILNSSNPVLICSDKSKNVNASGLDSGFYDDMHNYFTAIDDYDWFIVINDGACETAVCTESGSKMVGQKPVGSYSGKSYEEIYNAAVSEIE